MKNEPASLVGAVMTEFVKRLRLTFGSHLCYVGSTTASDDDSGDIDVLVELHQLSDTHIRHVWNIISTLRSTWNIALDCRIRSSKDLRTLPLLETYLLSLFLQDYFGKNPFPKDTPSPTEIQDACRRRIEQQEQRILALLPRVALEHSRLREIAQSVFDAARALLVLNGTPQVNKRDACDALVALSPAFDEIRSIYEGYLNFSAVRNIPVFIADALSLVKHLAYRAQSYPLRAFVLLVNIPSTVTPHPLDDLVGHDANMPLGLVCVASYLITSGVNAQILDAYALNLSASGVIDEIAKPRVLPRVVGLNSASPNIDVVFAIAKYLKRIDERITVVCGGLHATLAPQHTLSLPFIDYIVSGEGELPFTALCQHVIAHQSEPPPVIPGVYRRGDAGTPVGSPNPNALPLQELPRPRFDLLPLREVYFQRRQRLYIHTTRGCRFRCVYCSVHKFWNGSVKEVPMPVLLDHIDYAIHSFHPSEFQIVDDDFSHKRGDRILEFCRAIHARSMAFRWKCQVRADQLSADHVSAMREAGCFEVDIGIESGNPTIQHQIKKGLQLDRTREFVKALHDSGIIAKGFFILGFPSESSAQIQDTINFAIELKPLGLADVAFFPAMPFPGTELGELAGRLFGHEVLRGAVMDPAVSRDTSFASYRLRKYAAMPEVSLNAHYTPHDLRVLAKFAYEHFEHAVLVAHLDSEFLTYNQKEEALLYG